MNNNWSAESFFYHIYPLGQLGAPKTNIFNDFTDNKLARLADWTEYLSDLGINAVYLGPLFQSTSHGYDTSDYFRVDQRLGDNESLKKLVKDFHDKNIKVVLDGVFNHVGRDFWAFKDVQQNLGNSQYCNWFSGLTFERQSPYNDPFSYDGWNGHYNLVKLNLLNDEVVEHLFAAIKMWIEDFNIDGLRLDVADCLEKSFMRKLHTFTKNRKDDFWLMGEVIHGDYRDWVNEDMLDSVTNYECYKGLYSSHVDNNYFEIAYSFERLFGESGIYKGFQLYNFADNHDVDRVVSRLQDPAHLYPLYFLLFTMPGIPSLYYGSEFGLEGKKENNDDSPLRPAIENPDFMKEFPNHDLRDTIKRLAKIREKK